MKIVIRLLMVIVFSLFLIGCSDLQEEKTYIHLYYPNSSLTDLVKVEDKEHKRKDYDIKVATEIIKGKPMDKKLSPILFKGIKLLSATLDKDAVTINLSQEFDLLSLEENLIIRAAIVRAYTEISGVNKVIFLIDGKLFMNSDKKSEFMKTDFFVINDFDSREKQRANVIFYYLDKEKDKLVKNIDVVQYTKDELEINTIRELLRGPISLDDKLKNIFPLSTVVYEAKTTDGVCIVKLNNGLSELNTEKDVELAVYSIVNTLTSIPGINSVQVMSDDELGIKFKGKKLYAKSLEKNESEKIIVVPK